MRRLAEGEVSEYHPVAQDPVMGCQCASNQRETEVEGGRDERKLEKTVVLHLEVFVAADRSRVYELLDESRT